MLPLIGKERLSPTKRLRAVYARSRGTIKIGSIPLVGGEE